MDKRKRVRECFPLVDQIKNQDLRNRVIDVWVNAWEAGEWRDIGDLLNTVLGDRKCSLVEHTNYVVRGALALASIAQDMWKIEVDTDLLLAASILHDADKIACYEPDDSGQEPEKQTEMGKDLGTGVIGAHLALDAGLPLKVAHLIATHTGKSAKSPNVIEGVFMVYADHTAADCWREPIRVSYRTK